MLNYWLEFEESIGRKWDKYLNKKVHKPHEEARVSFTDITKPLHIFYRLLGGEKGKDLQITDKRDLKVSRSLLEKLSFLGKEFYLTWQDEKSVYLPASFAYFKTKEENEMLYYWLVAMATQTQVNSLNLQKQNLQASLYLTKRYTGFEMFYKQATQYLSKEFEQLSFIDSFAQLYTPKNFLAFILVCFITSFTFIFFISAIISAT